MNDRSSDNPGVIAFPPLILLINAAASALIHFFVTRIPMFGNYRISLLCGIGIMIIAPTLAISAMVTFKRAGTNVHPSEPALTIVRAGPYRFTRNPMYLTLCLVQIALGFFLNDGITLLFLVPLFLLLHFGVVLREERYLTTKFGEPYLELKRNVRRWL